MKFRPLHDRILAQRVTMGNTSSRGLFMPDTFQAKPLDSEELIILREDDRLGIRKP